MELENNNVSFDEKRAAAERETIRQLKRDAEKYLQSMGFGGLVKVERPLPKRTLDGGPKLELQLAFQADNLDIE